MRSWLGFLGVLVLLAIICGVFAFLVPFESDTASTGSFCPGSSNLMPNDTSYPHCSSPNEADYHLIKGQMQQYLDSKKCIDAHSLSCSSSTVKLFL